MDQKTSRPISAVSPHLVVAGAARAMEFYGRAFGAKELMKLEGPDGKLMHGCMSINGGTFMLMDEMPDHKALGPKAIGGTAVTIHLMVDDVDMVFGQALAAGATSVMPVDDMFWGDRYGIVEDPFGHQWSIASTKKFLTEAEIKEAAKNAMCGEGAKA